MAPIAQDMPRGVARSVSAGSRAAISVMIAGVTQPKKEHGPATGLQLLRETAQALRHNCPELGEQGFSLDDAIDLRTDAGLGRDYEVSTIAYKLYERGAVPNDSSIADRSIMIRM